MDDVRPLHQVFDALAAGASGAHPGQAHLDLPDDLLTEAIISYADTAPAEVAAHLAPFVGAHSPIPATPGADHGEDAGNAAHGLDLLASAPVGYDLSEPYAVEQLDGLDPLAEPASAAVTDLAPPEVLELGFGHGDELPTADDVTADEDGLGWDSTDADLGWTVPDQAAMQATGTDAADADTAGDGVEQLVFGAVGDASDDDYGSGGAEQEEPGD